MPHAPSVPAAPTVAAKQALIAEPNNIWSKTPSTVHVEFANRTSSGSHPEDVFRQLVAEIAEHHATGQINNRDAHRAANEAFGRLMMSRKKTGARKQAWSGWGPANTKGRRHKVAGWEWDEYQNGYVASKHRQFECSCGTPVKVPDYHNCKCGKIWNTYVIGTGGDRHEASAERFIAREIPARSDVIIAQRKRAACPECGVNFAKGHDSGCSSISKRGKTRQDDLQSVPQKKHDSYSEELDESASGEFPTKHSPKVDTRSKGVQNGKSTKDWHNRDHASQQYR